jgi:hypothetical protein
MDLDAAWQRWRQHDQWIRECHRLQWEAFWRQTKQEYYDAAYKRYSVPHVSSYKSVNAITCSDKTSWTSAANAVRAASAGKEKSGSQEGDASSEYSFEEGDDYSEYSSEEDSGKPAPPPDPEEPSLDTDHDDDDKKNSTQPPVYSPTFTPSQTPVSKSSSEVGGDWSVDNDEEESEDNKSQNGDGDFYKKQLETMRAERRAAAKKMQKQKPPHHSKTSSCLFNVFPCL